MSVQKQKTVQFEYQSEMEDVGLYQRSFVFKRLHTPLELEIKRTKSLLMGGNQPVSDFDANYIEMIAWLTVLCEPVDLKPGEKWMDEIYDVNVLAGIYKAISDYQLSFMPGKKHGSHVKTDKHPAQS